MPTETKGTKFHKLYNATEGERKEEMEPIVEEEVRMRFKAALTDAKKSILSRKGDIKNLYANIDHLDINAIVQNTYEIERFEKTIELTKKEFMALFNEPLS